MKVFQCIHQYPPYMPDFEGRYRAVLHDLSFEAMRQLLVADGYASTYVLQPALEGRTTEVFYTLWDYAPLQHRWATEHGLRTRDLAEIKLAQLEAFRPDVFYNHSPRYDGGFVRRLAGWRGLVKVCWDAIINPVPPEHAGYDLRLTLFEPYVAYWNQHGLPARILPPALPPAWEGLLGRPRDIDVLFYGQYEDQFFSGRNALIDALARWAGPRRVNLALHLQRSPSWRPLLDLPGLRWLKRPAAPPPWRTARLARPPVYGQPLYETIARSKIVVNAFTDWNGLYKDNMRNYEGPGCGAVLVGEDGIYPEPLVPGQDVLTYRSSRELVAQLEHVLALPDQGAALAARTRDKLKDHFSKENQWNRFLRAVSEIAR